MDNCRRLCGVLLLVTLAGCRIDGDPNPPNPAGEPLESASDSANRPPNITGNPPPAVTVDNRYSFTPAASDPDGDALSFSIRNKPDWLEFDPETGRLHGVAPAGSEGIYEDVTISVSDGILESALSPFTIEVTQIALGSVTLQWVPPTQNTDGTPIVDLAGYRIYYGLSADSFPNSISIDNPGITSYVVENLVPATYYFAATSFNSAGVESRYSNVAALVVDTP